MGTKNWVRGDLSTKQSLPMFDCLEPAMLRNLSDLVVSLTQPGKSMDYIVLTALNIA